MKLLPGTRTASLFFLVIAIAWVPVHAQSGSGLLATTDPAATVRSVRAMSVYDGAAIEIISDRPVVPTIRKLENPSRVVIDLPNASLSSKQPLDFHSEEVKDVRISQFQQKPPVARIVVDLAAPMNFTWDAAGNRLMVRLRAADKTAKLTPSGQPGESEASAVSAAKSTGKVMLVGTRVPTGASVTAGLDPSILSLERGGEVKVCPGTTVSVTTSRNGGTLMLAMSTGALEAHYSLDASADSIVTPDFRILMAGPGEFDYGVSADTHGNTCIQALPGNTASVIVSELLGDGTYQVKPSEQVMFHSGQLRAVDRAVTSACGCPTPAAALSASTGSLPPVTAPLPSSKSGDVHVQVDVPFVFNANDLPQAQPAPIREAQLLPVRELAGPSIVEAALPPDAKPAHRSVLARIGHFFRAIFS
jgi:hypothetical protein